MPTGRAGQGGKRIVPVHILNRWIIFVHGIHPGHLREAKRACGQLSLRRRYLQNPEETREHHMPKARWTCACTALSLPEKVASFSTGSTIKMSRNTAIPLVTEKGRLTSWLVRCSSIHWSSAFGDNIPPQRHSASKPPGNQRIRREGTHSPPKSPASFSTDAHLTATSPMGRGHLHFSNNHAT